MKRTRLVLPGLAGFAVLAMASSAQAQNVSRQVTRPQLLQGGDKVIKPAPPPALPGSKPAGDTVIPAERAPGDMSPTDALFDAINRGDAAGAKDALNRGADLDGRNVLGQTPIDLSIDTGRNDISFLLLSMRGGGPVHPGGPAPTAVAQAPARPSARAGRLAREAAVPATTRTVAPQTPQLFAGNGGTPVPQAGFLGFSGSRAP